jgi:DNA/RNA-binding domain of Phe-tRNA-synthetase-like protein
MEIVATGEIVLCVSVVTQFLMLETIEIAKEFDGAARIGILQIDGVRVEDSPEDLKSMLDGLAGEYAQKYKDQPLGEIPTVKNIRGIFHRSGLDPTRYRPSSESLLRRAVKGKGLYFINSVVDLVNYFSLKLLWPIGLYDADKLQPPVSWRVGQEGESYEGIGRDKLNLANFPLLVDQQGPFGSPISDSMRTRVTSQCKRILWVTFAPVGARVPNAEFAETMIRFNGGVTKVAKEL